MTFVPGARIFFPSWIWAVLLAPIIGSFLGVIVTRHEAFMSAMTGRSACATCGSKLQAPDLVPLLSWAVLGGKCRHCKAPIGLFYPLIELGAIAVALWSASVFSGAALWFSCGLGWTLLALAAADMKYFLLPDILTLPLIAGGLLAIATLDANNLTYHVMLGHLIGVLAGYGFVRVLRFIYRLLRGREGMGLGDAKLFAAAGAWVSWQGLPSVLVIASLSALVAVLIWRGRPVEAAQRVPFGVFLAIGLWMTWLYGPLATG